MFIVRTGLAQMAKCVLLFVTRTRHAGRPAIHFILTLQQSISGGAFVKILPRVWCVCVCVRVNERARGKNTAAGDHEAGLLTKATLLVTEGPDCILGF